MKNLLLLIIFFTIIISINAGIFNNSEKVRQSLAILPFENFTGNSENDNLKLDSLRILFHYLYLMRDFRLIEMEKIGDIIGEKLDFDKNYNRDAYINAVKSLGVELILFGSITSLETIVTEKTILIKIQAEARIVRLLNGEVVSLVKKEFTLKKKNVNTYSLKDLVNQVLEKCLKSIAKKITKDATK